MADESLAGLQTRWKHMLDTEQQARASIWPPVDTRPSPLLHVNVSVEREPLKGIRPQNLPIWLKSMKVELIRCIMHTDKVFNLPTVPLANVDPILQDTLGKDVGGRAMEEVAQKN